MQVPDICLVIKAATTCVLYTVTSYVSEHVSRLKKQLRYVNNKVPVLVHSIKIRCVVHIQDVCFYSKAY